MPKVMIDAGHYNLYNRSPAVPEYWESKMTWALHLKLIAELEKFGIECGRTRTDQKEDMEVYERGTKARGYDMFLSLHSNAVGSVVNESVDRPVVLRLYSDPVRGEAFAREVADMLHELMNTKQGGKVDTRLITGSEREYYGVLRGAKAVGCPHAFIIEHSFHTATAPAKWLLDDSNLQRAAEKEGAIIAKFFGMNKQEDNEMTEADVKKIVAAEIDSARREDAAKIDSLDGKVAELEKYNHVYHWYSQLPDYARDTIERLHRDGVFKGAGPDDMALTEDMMRILLILANNGVLKS